jgi:hypothetical protein
LEVGLRPERTGIGVKDDPLLGRIVDHDMETVDLRSRLTLIDLYRPSAIAPRT